MADKDDRLVEHEEREGIHIFTFYANSREAMRAYLDKLREIGLPHKETNGDAPLYIVMDISRKGMFSLSYARSQLRNRDDRLEIPLYIAYLGNPDSDPFLMELLSSMLPQLRNKRRIFEPGALEQAIAWLRASGAPPTSDDVS